MADLKHGEYTSIPLKAGNSIVLDIRTPTKVVLMVEENDGITIKLMEPDDEKSN